MATVKKTKSDDVNHGKQEAKGVVTLGFQPKQAEAVKKGGAASTTVVTKPPPKKP
jgi:hypothetical protein